MDNKAEIERSQAREHWIFVEIFYDGSEANIIKKSKIILLLIFCDMNMNVNGNEMTNADCFVISNKFLA